MFLAVAALVWWPEHSHYQIPEQTLSSAAVDTLLVSPSAQVLDRLAKVDLMHIDPRDKGDQAIADMILQGRIDVPLITHGEATLQGWPQDLEAPSAVDGLVLVSLELEDRMLRQYEATSDARYLQWAQRRLLDFLNYEANLYGPVGYIWNDHAVAARVSVLTRFWMILRKDPAAPPELKARVLRSVMRHGEFLAKKSHFTVQTNHGVMQNIALLQVALGFPALPSSDAWKTLALTRLKTQLAFYVSPEGVILEHSPGYHLFGTALMQHIVDLHEIMGPGVPAALQAQYEGVLRYLGQVMRPDCSLPRVGNTSGGTLSVSNVRGPFCGRAPPPSGSSAPYRHTFPIAGYALWGQNAEKTAWQTFVAWSHHLNHPHKHADETSLVYWRDGIEWITAVGYWPYDSNGYRAANGWKGSNAPHGIREIASSERSTELVYSGSAEGVEVVDTRTLRGNGMQVRRQAIQLDADRLLVVDHVAGSREPVETIWTMDHALSLRKENDGEYVVVHDKSGDRMEVAFASMLGAPLAIEVVKGQMDPFAGWTVVDAKPVETHSIRYERSEPESATAHVFDLKRAGAVGATRIERVDFKGPERWHLTISTGGQVLDVSRDGPSLMLDSSKGTQRIPLMEVSTASQAHPALDTAMRDALTEFPRWKDHRYYRLRMLAVLGVLWAVALLGTVVLVRFGARYRYLDVASVAVWSSLGLWLSLVYFQ
ncbi:MAG: heparinase II/III family protein [Hydrogenophaga sp.]